MSYETQQQNQPEGVPSSPYSAPVVPAPPTGGNGFAVASLITGILPLPPLGLIFGFLGLSQAKKIGGTGKGMAIIGIVLSILWIGGIAAITPSLIDTGKKVAKAVDPGCVSATNLSVDAASKMRADSSDLGALKTDLSDIVTGLKDAAGKSKNGTASTAITKLAGDYQELLDDLNNTTAPSADLQSRLTTDGRAVDTACGRD